MYLVFIIIIVLIIFFVYKKIGNNKKPVYQVNYTLKKLSKSIKPQNKINLSKFIKKNNNLNYEKKNIWIYIPQYISSRFWLDFYSRRYYQGMPKYMQLAYNSIINKNKYLFNIHVVTDNNIKNYIPDIKFDPSDIRIDKNLKLDYIKYNLLYRYGGMWVLNSVLAFKDFSELFRKLDEYDLVLFKCQRDMINCENKSVNTDNILSRKNTPILRFIVNNINKLMKEFNIYNYINNSNRILQNYCNSKNSSCYIISSEYNGSRDYLDKSITIENLVSNNFSIFLNPNKVIFMDIGLNTKKNLKYGWLERLSVKQLLSSNIWLSKLIRFSYGLEQKYFQTYKDGISNLKIISYNKVPDNIHDFEETLQNINQMLYNPYDLISREAFRNT